MVNKMLIGGIPPQYSQINKKLLNYEQIQIQYLHPCVGYTSTISHYIILYIYVYPHYTPVNHMNVNLWSRKSSPQNWRGRFFVTIYDALLLESKSPPMITSPAHYLYPSEVALRPRGRELVPGAMATGTLAVQKRRLRLDALHGNLVTERISAMSVESSHDIQLWYLLISIY